MRNKPIAVLLDTDIGPDCDDAGALALLHGLADRRQARILGVMHCTSSIYGTGCIDAINRFFGRPDIPVGTLKKDGFLVAEEYEKYNRPIAENYYNAYTNQPAPDATRLYRRILAEQPDHSVEFISIGPLVNLALLLESQPDDISDLSGYELINSKVIELVAMAGRFDRDENGRLQAEWNVRMDIEASQKVVHNWPSPVVLCGHEAGFGIVTGKRLMSECKADNPVKRAYELFTKGEGRSSWDLVTVLFAILRENGLWELSPKGTIQIDDEGVSLYTENREGKHSYLKNKAPEKMIEQFVDDLLLDTCLGR